MKKRFVRPRRRRVLAAWLMLRDRGKALEEP